jgi:hypothetical protein
MMPVKHRKNFDLAQVRCSFFLMIGQLYVKGGPQPACCFAGYGP